MGKGHLQLNLTQYCGSYVQNIVWKPFQITFIYPLGTLFV